MRSVLLCLSTLLFTLLFVACGDVPTASSARDMAGVEPLRSGECMLLSDGTYYCPPLEPDWGDGCDEYHYDCGGGDCIASAGSGNPEEATAQGCTGGGGGDGGTIGDGNGGTGGGTGGGGGGGGGSSPSCPDHNPDCGTQEDFCDPAIHPDCEQPLTVTDTATINAVLRDFLRPASAFTDSVAQRECAQLASSFRNALAAGAVFRGEFDSDMTNDPYGSHSGMYNVANGNIHFDPSGLDAANAGNVEARREIAITALHEIAHRSGYVHPNGTTFDSLGRDSYTDPPFHRLNPGPNSCVPR